MCEYNGRLINNRVNAFFFPGLITTLSITGSMFLDIAIVGQMLGTDAMGAVSLSLPITMFFSMIYMLLGTGGEVLISAAKGAGNKKQADKLFTLSILSIMAISICIALLGIVGYTDNFAIVLSRNNAIMENLIKEYIRVIFIGAPCLIGVMSMAYFIKVDAMPKLSAGIMVVSNIVNIGSKIIYMGTLNMGIAGAAYGTITGSIVGFVLMFPYLFFRHNRTLEFTNLSKRDFNHVPNIIITGLPSALGQGLGALTTFAVNAIIMQSIGAAGIVINTVCNSMIIIISSFRYGAASAIVPLVGALYGEHDWWSMHQVATRILKIVLIFVVVSIGIIQIIPENILRFFGIHETILLAKGVIALRIFSLSLLLLSVNHILMTYMQTTARKIFSILISIAGEVLSVICVYLLADSGWIILWFYPLLGNIILLLGIIIAAKYIGKKSNGHYHGIFLHEIQPNFVLGNSIYMNQDSINKYLNVLEKFMQNNNISSEKIFEIKNNLNKLINEIIGTGDKKKTADIMAVINDDELSIRIRDDCAANRKIISDNIRQISVMGYNNTYIIFSVK